MGPRFSTCGARARRLRCAHEPVLRRVLQSHLGASLRALHSLLCGVLRFAPHAVSVRDAERRALRGLLTLL